MYKLSQEKDYSWHLTDAGSVFVHCPIAVLNKNPFHTDIYIYVCVYQYWKC